jgi:hypothetical protein
MSSIESAESEYHDDSEAGRIGAASGFTGEPTLGVATLARR